MKLYTYSELQSLEQKGIVVDQKEIRILLEPADETPEVKKEMERQWKALDKLLFRTATSNV